jgi:hypothetical protein
MIGIKYPASGCFAMEVPVLAGKNKYSFPDISFLREKYITHIRVMNSEIMDSIIPSGAKLVNKTLLPDCSLSLIDNQNRKIVDALPLTFFMNVDFNNILINSKLNISNCFIETNGNIATGYSFYLLFFYSDVKKPEPGIGFIKASIPTTIGKNSLANEAIYKDVEVISFYSEGITANPFYLTIIDTQGRIVIDSVADTNIGQERVTYDSNDNIISPINDLNMFLGLKIDWNKSSVFSTSAKASNYQLGVFFLNKG